MFTHVVDLQPSVHDRAVQRVPLAQGEPLLAANGQRSQASDRDARGGDAVGAGTGWGAPRQQGGRGSNRKTDEWLRLLAEDGTSEEREIQGVLLLLFHRFRT